MFRYSCVQVIVSSEKVILPSFEALWLDTGTHAHHRLQEVNTRNEVRGMMMCGEMVAIGSEETMTEGHRGGGADPETGM